MKCPNCNEEVPETANVCGFCGTKLENKQKTRICGDCGAEVNAAAKFCDICGAALTPPPKPAEKAKPATATRKKAKPAAPKKKKDASAKTKMPAQTPVEDKIPVEEKVASKPQVEEKLHSVPKPAKNLPATTPFKLPKWLLPVVLAAAALLVIAIIFVPRLNHSSDIPPREVAQPEEKQAPQSPFYQAEGNWTAEDIGDGSKMSMTIRSNPDGSFKVSIRDEGASICGEDENGNPIMAANASVIGFPEDYLLYISEMKFICENSETIGNFDEVLTYDPSTDTITENLGAVWNRE